MFEKIKEKRNSKNKGGGKVAENQEKPKIKIEKEYEIKDNVSVVENMSVMIYIYDQAYHLLAINQDSFIPADEGEYFVRIWCIDDYGNYTVASYKIYAR